MKIIFQMNITYLLGAGASSECLPIYKNFQNRFNSFVSFLNAQKDIVKPENINKINDLLKNYLAPIQKEFQFHSTPDTIAKKYFHSRNDDSLKHLKIVLILFFVYEQSTGLMDWDRNEEIIKSPIDKRYDAFVAAILKPIPKKMEFLNNIKILTWNYDLQFEISFSKYFDNIFPKPSVSEIQNKIQSYPKVIENNGYDENKFSLIHLNGIAYACLEDRDTIGSFISDNADLANYLISLHDSLYYSTYNEDAYKRLSFAWENINEDYSLKQNGIIKRAIDISLNTELLVVNGYSFPIFNRAIDLELLKNMKKLKAIYIQSPTGADVKNILDEIFKKTNIKTAIFDIGYYNQFFIPDWSNKPRSEIHVGVAFG